MGPKKRCKCCFYCHNLSQTAQSRNTTQSKRETESRQSQINKMKRKPSLRTNTKPQKRSINLQHVYTHTHTHKRSSHALKRPPWPNDFYKSEHIKVITKLITCPSVITVSYKMRRKLTWPVAIILVSCHETHTLGLKTYCLLILITILLNMYFMLQLLIKFPIKELANWFYLLLFGV